jgi:ATP-dependent Clp protease ATP-binding subunit ClpA
VIDETGASQMLVPESRRKKVIGVKEVEEVVAKMARIPPKSVSKTDAEQLRNLETDLKRVVFGQDDAIHALASAIKLARAGLRQAEKPIGCYLFSGPTGVGKTEVAKQLASIMGVELLRFDMSEYMERHTVSRLIGAPPGYVGYEEGGYLTEAVRRRPYSVVLLDEIEKAHGDVFNTLLQVMDDGRLTDGQGRTVDFKNTVLIMTSNIPVAAEVPDADAAADPRAAAGADARLRSELLDYFKPEFINRLDDIVRFDALSREQISEIVELQVDRVIARVAERGVEVTLTDEAKRLLGNMGYDPTYGARPLRRVIQKQLTDRLALALLEGRLREGEGVRIDARNGELVLEQAAVGAAA